MDRLLISSRVTETAIQTAPQRRPFSTPAITGSEAPLSAVTEACMMPQKAPPPIAIARSARSSLAFPAIMTETLVADTSVPHTGQFPDKSQAVLRCLRARQNEPMATPLIIHADDRTVVITVQQRTAVSPADAFRIIVPVDLPTIFLRWGPFPGVTGVANQAGPWDHVGVTRNPQLDDGTQAEERLTEYVEGTSFAYQLTGFTNVLARLTEGVRGEWNFNPDGSGTLVRWAYEFLPRPGRWWILAGPFMPLWRRYMRDTLRRALDMVEAEAPIDS